MLWNSKLSTFNLQLATPLGVDRSQGTSHFEKVTLLNPKAGAHQAPVQASGITKSQVIWRNNILRLCVSLTQVCCLLATGERKKSPLTKYPSTAKFSDSPFQQNSASRLSHRNAHGLGVTLRVSNTSPCFKGVTSRSPDLAEGLLHMACFRRSRQHKDLGVGMWPGGDTKVGWCNIIPSGHRTPFKVNI